VAWTYEVDTDLVAKNFTTTLKLDVFGGINANVTLDFAPTAQKKSVVKGSIDYECKRSKFHKEDGPGGCVMYNLKREPPAESPKIVVTLLENQIPGALKIGALSGTYKLIQPKVTVTPNMQVTESNENQCYNVFVDVTAEFTPGQIDFSFTFPVDDPGSEKSEPERHCSDWRAR
jgi:hypothetical protein